MLRLPKSEEEKIIDFEIFSIVLPKSSVPSDSRPSAAKYDLSFDLSSRELIFSADHMTSPKAYFPGGLKEEIKRANSDPTKIQRAKDKRFVCELVGESLGENKGNYYLRLNNRGISFRAKVSKKRVDLLGESEQLREVVAFEPKDKGPEFESQIHIEDNHIKAASIFSTVNLPSFKNLRANVSVSLRKENPEQAPTILTRIDLDTKDKKPIGKLNLAGLQMQLTAWELTLKWNLETHHWALGATADGAISFTEEAQIVEELKALKNLSAIEFKNLDLLRLNLEEVEIGLELRNDVHFSINPLYTTKILNIADPWFITV